MHSTNPNYDTSLLERQIDIIVYDLYGITDVGIKTIEQKSKYDNSLLPRRLFAI